MRTSKKAFAVCAALVMALALPAVGGCSGAADAGSADGTATLADTGLGKTTVTEDELDTAIGAYVYNGKTQEVTIREVLEAGAGLESYVDEDGNYAVPTADDVLDYSRDQVIIAVMDEEGIEVDDAYIEQYEMDYLGTTDLESIAELYSMDVEQLEYLVNMGARANALKEQVVSVQDPDKPTAPESEDDYSTATEEYAQYIIEIAGDEWDAEGGTWADASGDLAAQLPSFDGKTASYEDAYNAWYVLASQVQTEWAEYINGIYSEAQIVVYTLAS